MERKVKIQNLKGLGWFYHTPAHPTTLTNTTLKANFANSDEILYKSQSLKGLGWFYHPP